MSSGRGALHWGNFHAAPSFEALGGTANGVHKDRGAARRASRQAAGRPREDRRPARRFRDLTRGGGGNYGCGRLATVATIDEDGRSSRRFHPADQRDGLSPCFAADVNSPLVQLRGVRPAGRASWALEQNSPSRLLPRGAVCCAPRSAVTESGARLEITRIQRPHSGGSCAAWSRKTPSISGRVGVGRLDRRSGSWHDSSGVNGLPSGARAAFGDAPHWRRAVLALWTGPTAGLPRRRSARRSSASYGSTSTDRPSQNQTGAVAAATRTASTTTAQLALDQAKALGRYWPDAEVGDRLFV